VGEGRIQESGFSIQGLSAGPVSQSGRPAALQRPKSEVKMKSICLLPSALCLLLSAFCSLPSALCLLLSAFCLLPSAFCLLLSAFRYVPRVALEAHSRGDVRCRDWFAASQSASARLVLRPRINASLGFRARGGKARQCARRSHACGTPMKRLFWVRVRAARWRIDWPRTNRGI